MPYCTIEDLRNEGYGKCDFTDRRVQEAIEDATSLIERFTGRFFEPRSLTFSGSWRGSLDLLVEQPIISIEELRFKLFDGSLGSAFEATDFVVFNRHAREGLIDPDDRESPRISFIFMRPELIIPRTSRPSLQVALMDRVQNVQVKGVFGYTNPVYTGARSIASNAGDAVTAPNTIKMVNGAFSVAGGDLGRKITIANSAVTNNGEKTIVEIVSSDTIKTAETLVTEGSGFTASIATFPQYGVTPREIKRACRLLASRNLAPLALRDPLDTALASGRVKRLAVRDQSVEFSVDRRTESGGAMLGDPEIESLLVPLMRPLKLGAA